MKLTIAERIVLPELLPGQGNMIEMLLVRSIERKVEFTAAEVGEYGLRGDDGVIRWRPEMSDAEVEIALETAEVELLRECYRRMDGEKKVTRRNLSLCMKLKEL